MAKQLLIATGVMPPSHEGSPLLQKNDDILQKEPLNPSGELSPIGAVLVLFCTAAGPGIVVIPRALSFSGWAAGLLALIGSATLSALSLSCLFKCAELERAPSSYQSLVQKYFPTGLGLFVELAVATLLLGTIGTMLLLATSVWANIELALGIVTQSQDHVPWVLLFVAVVLCLPRNFADLEIVSIVNLVATLSVVLIISVESAKVLYNAEISGGLSTIPCHETLSACVTGLLAALPITFYSFFCQFQAPSLYTELQPSHQRDASSIGGLAIFGCFFVYMCVGLLGYAAFGASTDSDILAQLSKYDPKNRWLSLGHFMFGCVLLLSTPLVLAPLRSMILRRLAEARDSSKFGNFVEAEDISSVVHVGATTCIVSLALLLGLNVPGVDFIMGLLGATCVVFLALIVPGILTLKCCGDQRKIQGCVLLVTGLICAPLTFGAFVARHSGYL